MDVPLALNDIGIRRGLKYKRISSMFCLPKTDFLGLLAYLYPALLVTFTFFIVVN